MPSILLFPLLPFVLEVALVVYWAAVTAMLYTAGDLAATCRVQSSHELFSVSTLGNYSASYSITSTSTAGCYSNFTG